MPDLIDIDADLSEYDPAVQLTLRFNKAVREVGTVTKSETANTGSYSYSYTTLNQVLGVVKEALDTVGLVLTQPCITQDGQLLVQVVITDMHTGFSAVMAAPGVTLKNDPQQAGSAISYFRRYGLVSLFGIEQHDDDGALATASSTERTDDEKEIRDWMAAIKKENRAAFVADFGEHFGSTLTNLPVQRHGEARAFMQEWVGKHMADGS